MLDKRIVEYYDNIEPSSDLIERTVIMSKNTDKKIKRLPKRTAAILAAAIILVVGITGYAAGSRIINDKKGVVSMNTDGGFVFDFSKVDVTPDSYSTTDSSLVATLTDLGYSRVLLPKDMLDDSLIIYDTKHPFINEKGCMISLKNKDIDVTLQIFRDMTPEDMNGFYGTGDENTICRVYHANGIDVCLNIEGTDEVGYCAYLFYAADSTYYCINFFADENYDIALEKAVSFLNSINQ